MKLRIVVMVLVTCALGSLLGGQGRVPVARLAWALLGTALMAGGAGALNQYLEREADGRMPRTRGRPLPSGLIPPPHALAFGLCAVLAGCAILVGRVNLLTAYLGLLSSFLYVLAYTPLKRVTWLNTSLGAVPGAIPPLMGWTAATNQLAPPAWALFALLFLWQHVHFYAIAWIFRDEYRQAGFRMLPALEHGSRRSFGLIVAAAAAMVPVSLAPAAVRLTGAVYAWGAPLACAVVLAAGVGLALAHSRAAACRVLRLSVWYPPLLLGMLACDLCL